MHGGKSDFYMILKTEILEADFWLVDTDINCMIISI